MFESDIEVHGEHSDILKKYSKNSQAEVKVSFNVIKPNGETTDLTLFNTQMDTYLISCGLGIANKRKSSEYGDKTKKTTIFLAKITKTKDQLNHLVQLMILTEDNDHSINQRIKDAFSIKNIHNKEYEDELHSYALGGLEILDSYFKDCKTEEDVAQAIGDLNLDFSIESESEM